MIMTMHILITDPGTLICGLYMLVYIFFKCMYVCMYVCTYGWMDGWPGGPALPGPTRTMPSSTRHRWLWAR